MAGFSYVQAIGAGFRVLGRKPWAVLAWAAAYLVLATLPLLLIMSQLLPDIISTYRDAAHQLAHGIAPDASRAVALRNKVSGFQPLILLIELVAYTVLIGAVFRAVLEPQESRFGYLRLGRRELWLGLSLVIFILMAAVLVFTLLAVLAVGGSVGVVSAHYGHSPGPMAYPLLRLIQLVCGLVIIWAMLRLSLALPMSFAERRFVFYEAWGLTRGQSLKLFGVGVTLFVVLFICDIAATIALKTLLVERLAHAAAWRETLRGPPTEVARRLTPIMIGMAIVGAVLGMTLFAVLVAPFADIYRQLRGEKAAA